MKNRGVALNEHYEVKVVERFFDGKLRKTLTIDEDITHQNQALILMCQKGEVKSDPMLGVGIDNIVGESDFLAIRAEIMRQLEREGQRVDRLVVGPDRLIVEAVYHK